MKLVFCIDGGDGMFNWKRKVFPYVLLTPNLILFGLFLFYPAINGLIYSFHKWDGLGPMKYIALKNYANLLKDSGFIGAMERTLVYTLFCIPLIYVCALLLALIVSKPLRGVSFFRITFYFPFMLSAIITGFSWRFLLSDDFSLTSYIFSSFGMEQVHFLTNPKMAMATLIGITVWGSCGYYMMMFVAGLKNISEVYYEAARIDGANSLQCFWSITFPLLKPTSLMVLILSSLGVIRSYALVKAVTGGGPGTATKFIVQLIYDTAFSKNRLGYASAMTMILFVILALFTLIQFRLIRGGEQDVQ